MDAYAKKMKIIGDSVAHLMEHFDSVQIICTSRDKDRSTCQLYDNGDGCIYSRLGAVREWSIVQEECAKSFAQGRLLGDE